MTCLVLLSFGIVISLLPHKVVLSFLLAVLKPSVRFMEVQESPPLVFDAKHDLFFLVTDASVIMGNTSQFCL